MKTENQKQLTSLKEIVDYLDDNYDDNYRPPLSEINFLVAESDKEKIGEEFIDLYKKDFQYQNVKMSVHELTAGLLSSESEFASYLFKVYW